MNEVINIITNPNIPNQEYLLQGSVLDSAVEVLLHRLRGLCDCVDSGPDKFQDLEMGFAINLTSVGGGLPQTVVLKVRRSIDSIDAPWRLKYVGQSELGDKNRPTVVRNTIDVACSSNIVQFLNELGFRVEYEFMVKGYQFRKGRMNIVVSKIFRMAQGKPPDGLEPVSSSYLVEVGILAPAGEDIVADDVKSFAEQLKPLVQLEKIDQRRL